MVQLIETGELAGVALLPKAAAGTNAAQEERTVTETPNEAEEVAARAGVEMEPNARRTNAAADEANLIG